MGRFLKENLTKLSHGQNMHDFSVNLSLKKKKTNKIDIYYFNASSNMRVIHPKDILTPADHVLSLHTRYSVRNPKLHVTIPTMRDMCPKFMST